MSVIFVIDIDGTVCDSIGRVKEICKNAGKTPTNDIDTNIDLDLENIWTDEVMKEFLREENIMKDEVILGAEKILEIAHRCRATPFFLTGRNEYARKATRKWLSVKLGVPNNIPLIMRPYEMKDGYTTDCKEQIFKEQLYSLGGPHSTYIFFEDNPETVFNHPAGYP